MTSTETYQPESYADLAPIIRLEEPSGESPPPVLWWTPSGLLLVHSDRTRIRFRRTA